MTIATVVGSGRGDVARVRALPPIGSGELARSEWTTPDVPCADTDVIPQGVLRACGHEQALSHLRSVWPPGTAPMAPTKGCVAERAQRMDAARTGGSEGGTC